jgi:hypothetical protein
VSDPGETRGTAIRCGGGSAGWQQGQIGGHPLGHPRGLRKATPGVDHGLVAEQDETRPGCRSAVCTAAPSRVSALLAASSTAMLSHLSRALPARVSWLRLTQRTAWPSEAASRPTLARSRMAGGVSLALGAGQPERFHQLGGSMVDR